MEKENWINGILNSTDGMQKPVPNAGLFSQIENRIREAGFVSPKTVWLAAASILILVVVNVAIVKKTARSEQAKPTTSIAASFNPSNQLYQ